MPLAVSVPYFRMAADRHYLTDVLVGAAVGTAVGIGVPLAFHGRVPAEVTLSVGPNSLVASGRF